MITIKCTEPVCGKEFQFDDEKYPNAKKTRCPYCKGIVDLAASESKIIKPIIEEGVVSPSIPIIPISTKEDNFNLQPKVNFPTSPVANSMEETTELPTSGINYKWLVLGGIVLVILSFILYRGCNKPPIPEAKPIYVMPEYKIKLDDNLQSEYSLHQPIKISGHIEPSIDSITRLELLLNNKLVYLIGENEFDLDTSFEVKKDLGNHVFQLKLNAFKSDSIIRVDSQNVIFNIVNLATAPVSKPSSNQGLKFVSRSLLDLAKTATWRAKDKIITFSTGIADYGHISNDVNKKLEDESERNGFTVTSGSKNNSVISGERIINPPALINVIKGSWGFHKIEKKGNKNVDVELEVEQFFEDGTSIQVYKHKKGYTEKLSILDYKFQPKSKTNKITFKITKKNNNQRKPIMITY